MRLDHHCTSTFKLRHFAEERYARCSNLFHVTMICTAAPTHHIAGLIESLIKSSIPA